MASTEPPEAPASPAAAGSSTDPTGSAGPAASGSERPAEAPPAGQGDKASADAPGTVAPRRRAAPAAPADRGVYVVPALLVVALVLLVVGLITSTSAWLAGSLIASVLAAVLLVVERLVQRRRAGRAAAADTATPAADDTGSRDTDAAPAPPVDLDAPAIDPDDPDAVFVVDGRPRYHARGCATLNSLPAEPIPRSQALEDGFVACSLCAPATT